MKSITCSWCHELNKLRHDGGRVFCWSCGHRADVPRVQCDCRKCRTSSIEIDIASNTARKRGLYREAS